MTERTTQNGVNKLWERLPGAIVLSGRRPEHKPVPLSYVVGANSKHRGWKPLPQGILLHARKGDPAPDRRLEDWFRQREHPTGETHGRTYNSEQRQ